MKWKATIIVYIYTITVTFLYMHKDWCDCSNSECNSQNGSLLEVDKKITWGYFS